MFSKNLVDILLMIFAISVLLSNIIFEKTKNKEKALNIVTFVMLPFFISVCLISLIFLFLGTSIFEIFLNDIIEIFDNMIKEKYIPIKFPILLNCIINMILTLPLIQLIYDFFSNKIFPKKKKQNQ